MNKFTSRINVLYNLVTQKNKYCPYCGNKNTTFVGRNAPISEVRKCPSCRLMFRWPKQSSTFNQSFYQRMYSKVHRSTATTLPDKDTLSAWRFNNFKGSPRDFSEYVNIIIGLGCKRVLDYGCSWGYGVHQFVHNNLDSVGFEISEERARFGREHLGVTIYTQIDDLTKCRPEFDCIFSSHVLEHIPDPKIFLSLFKALLVPGGYLVLEVPNCGGRKAREMGLQWGPFSSNVHPMSFTLDFFAEALAEYDLNIITAFDKPFQSEIVLQKTRQCSKPVQVDGEDLIIVASRSSGSLSK